MIRIWRDASCLSFASAFRMSISATFFSDLNSPNVSRRALMRAPRTQLYIFPTYSTDEQHFLLFVKQLLCMPRPVSPFTSPCNGNATINSVIIPASRKAVRSFRSQSQNILELATGRAVAIPLPTGYLVYHATEAGLCVKIWWLRATNSTDFKRRQPELRSQRHSKLTKCSTSYSYS